MKGVNMLSFIFGLFVGVVATILALALCKSAGRCPYQDDTGTCEFARKYERRVNNDTHDG